MNTQNPPELTGYEPTLATSQRGRRTLSLRGLATMLNVLPADAISLPAIAEALRSDTFYVRYSAAKKLSERRDRDARLLIQEVLDTGTAPSRASVARHLYAFSWFSAEPLLRQALKDEDSRVREAAIYALCDLRDLHAFQLMSEVLQHEADNVRDAAAWGLRDCQDSAAVPALKAALLAQNPDVRVRVLEALGANESPETLPVIRDAMHDLDPDVTYAATLSLIEVLGEGCLAELADVLRHTAPSASVAVLHGFFHATNYLKIDVSHSKPINELIDVLELLLRHEDAEVRRAAIFPLAWLRHERTPAILRNAYEQEQDRELKAAFGRIIPALAPDLRDEFQAMAATVA